ncbi:hypothetical protein ACFSUK_24345 [Sphingobium scionense]
MRYEEVGDDLRPLIYDFFFWFSRFESALKEANWLVAHDIGAPALPGWKDFVAAHEGQYQPSQAGADLIAANPLKQIVGDAGLDFTVVTFKAGDSQLLRVTILLRTVRNNLFHGGKKGARAGTILNVYASCCRCASRYSKSWPSLAISKPIIQAIIEGASAHQRITLERPRLGGCSGHGHQSSGSAFHVSTLRSRQSADLSKASIASDSKDERTAAIRIAISTCERLKLGREADAPFWRWECPLSVVSHGVV